MPSPDQSDRNILAMLERFASAFTAADGKAAAQCWEVPALIVADMGTKAVNTLREVEEFYNGAAGQYRDRGITGTHPEVLGTQWHTERLATVQVLWPYIDAKGERVKTTESTTYVIRVGDDGEPRITVAVMMGVKD